MPENIFTVQTEFLAIIFRFGKTGVREGINQIKQLVVVKLVLTNAIQDAFQL